MIKVVCGYTELLAADSKQVCFTRNFLRTENKIGEKKIFFLQYCMSIDTFNAVLQMLQEETGGKMALKQLVKGTKYS